MHRLIVSSVTSPVAACNCSITRSTSFAGGAGSHRGTDIARRRRSTREMNKVSVYALQRIITNLVHTPTFTGTAVVAGMSVQSNAALKYSAGA
ncbi:hypothetical protein [Burkholderia ubonensis]|uniref:hypothetical protein n=1 Tax=Burkholderia ubonensis TaxID=101571 RepID=UPI0012F72DDE|nr:hypothetical protein [Burkholderia ubonensis]